MHISKALGRKLAIAGCVMAAVLVAASAQAQTVVGGSDLLTAASSQQLSSWLGQGDLVFTNIFDKAPGNTSADFHVAADGRGATFSVIEALLPGGAVLIGGYNPNSWNSSGQPTITSTLTGRDAFVFNLSQSLVFRQNATAFGQFGANNSATSGPSFGQGVDLFVDSLLGRSSSFLASFGTAADFGKDLAKYPGPQFGDFAIGQIEVFAVAAAVPEVNAAAMLLVGLAAMGALGWQARRPN